MLCEICSHIDFEQALRQNGGVKHHASCSDLVKAADDGCALCRKIWSERKKVQLNEDSLPWKPQDYDQLDGRPLMLHLCNFSYLPSANGLFALLVSQGGLSRRKSSTFHTWLEIYADADSVAAKEGIISGRPIAKLSGSAEVYTLAKKWLLQCSEKHLHSCPAFTESRLPTRVLDIGISDKDDVYIRLTERQKGTWISLSHCWGMEKHFTLTSSTALAKSLNIQALPPTFRDAITVTRRLGYRYLWIDSLCILQDSRADWVAESSLMQEYYKYAMVTIAVDSAQGDHEGFLGKIRNAAQDGIQVPFWIGPKAKGDVYIRNRQSS